MRFNKNNPNNKRKIVARFVCNTNYSTAISDLLNASSWLLSDDFEVRAPPFRELVSEPPGDAFGEPFGGVGLALCFFEEDSFFGVEPGVVFRMSFLMLLLLFFADLGLALLDRRDEVSFSMICETRGLASL